MRILVADDNPVFQKVLQDMLTHWGYDVVAAGCGIEALGHLLAEDGPKLAILDWIMPGMDGLEVCRYVRSGGRTDYVYILILTAKTQCQELVEAMDAGADDYVSKPFKSQELRARLRAGCRILELQEQLLLAREGCRQPSPDPVTAGAC